MRILFGYTGGRGHVEPLLPLAIAAKEAGHAVAFAGRPETLPIVEALGFEAFAAEQPGKPPKRIPLQPLDLEREAQDFRHGFADRLARLRAPRVRELCGEWQPDAVVCEETDFGSMIAAESLGIPHATVLVLAAGFARAALVSDKLDAIRAEYELPSDPELAMPARHLVLAPFPASYRGPAFPLPETTHCFRPLAPAPARPTEPPTVCFTLGTVFNLECGDLFERVLAGLGKLPVEVVATIGPYFDPAELDLPPNTRVEEHIPQAEILRRCSAVVSHGGSGSVLGALAHGLPQVLIPMGADQPLNAARCAELGAAVALDPVAATPEDVRSAVATVLSEPSYREAAERLCDEFAALPGPEHAVMLVERIGAANAGHRAPERPSPLRTPASG